MTARSAGLLMYRRRNGVLEVFLVHPGGPFWAKRNWGSWSIPKGEHSASEDPLEAAKREFCEETGAEPVGVYRPLGEVRQRGGKVVTAWSVEGDCDPAAIKSNTFTVEWPLRSGEFREFPEIDRAGWFTIEEAGRRILDGQRPLLDRLRSQEGTAA